MPSLEIEYVEKKCQECKQIFEVRVDKAASLYGMYCPICFPYNVVEDIYGALRPKREDEKEIDTSYKDELVGTTHRGKLKVD